MARPKLPKALKRSVAVYVLLRPEESDQLDNERGRSSRGGHLRNLLLKPTATRRRRRLVIP